MLKSLAGKTRILVTHAMHFVGHANWVVVMDNGKIVRQGPVSELGFALGVDAPDDASLASTVEEPDTEIVIDSKVASPTEIKTERKPATNLESKQVGSVGAKGKFTAIII
jgi:energy-coupling factor transporter ATP-binding protein EcfA2